MLFFKTQAHILREFIKKRKKKVKAGDAAVAV